MSVKLDIFNDIVTEINKISEVETVELWNSQLENLTEETAFNFPAVFIEFAEIPWTTTNQQPSALGTQGNVTKEQKGDGTLITLHIGIFCYSGINRRILQTSVKSCRTSGHRPRKGNRLADGL